MSDDSRTPDEISPEEQEDKEEDVGASGGVDKHGHDFESSGEGEIFRKRPRQQSPSPRPSLSYSPAASPHKHSTFEELMATAGLIENMSLAHEIVMDGDFRLKQPELPKESIQRKIHDTMHEAFWDVLRSDLEEDPPAFDHAIRLLGEIRTTITSFLLPKSEKYRTEIEEVLDLDLIKQQAEHGALDVYHYAQFILSTMAKLCAPVRDDEIKGLHEIQDIVKLYREIFRVLDLMKLDMANFTIQSVRPHLQQHSIEYERDKFQKFLKVHQDGLDHTKKWLETVRDEMSADQPKENLKEGTSVDGATAAADSKSPSISPLSLMNHAYLKLLEWDPQKINKFPETVLMDQGRLIELGNQVKKACFIASVLLVTYTHVGPVLSGIQGLPSKLKFVISVIIADSSDINSVIPNIADQVCIEIKKCLSDHGYKEMESSKMEALKRQINDLGDENHTIRKLLDKRAKSFLLMSISLPPRTDLSSKLPPGLSTIERQMVQLASMFTRVVFHNRSVYGPFYSEIVGNLLQLEK